jgi:transposase
LVLQTVDSRVLTLDRTNPPSPAVADQRRRNAIMTALRTAEIDAATTALRAIVEHRDDLVKTRTQTFNRLHVVLTRLVPAGARRQLSADRAAALLRGVRPRDAGAKTLRALAMDLISEVRQLDRRIAKAANHIQMAISASGTTLTKLQGFVVLTAGKILGRVGDARRFRSAAAFASYTGTAPIEASSGELVRHRRSHAGDRQLNFCLHVMAITQVRHDTPAGATTCGNDPRAKVTTIGRRSFVQAEELDDFVRRKRYDHPGRT